MLKLLKKRKWLAIVLLLTGVLILPYFCSRVFSGSLRIQQFSVEPAARFPDDGEFTVACYNIAHGRGLADSNWDGGDEPARLQRLDEIADLLKEMNADVVVLNEVDFDTSWSNHVNQAKYIADRSGYPFRIEQRNLDFRVLHRTWRFGNAILSKFPVSNAKVIDLPSFATLETVLAGKKRGVQCDVTVGDRQFRVLGVHLSHRSEYVRVLSAEKITQIVNNSPFPCIVMGDMNSTPPGMPYADGTEYGGNAIDTFDNCEKLRRIDFEGTPANAEMTFRADQPKSVIDWIFADDSLDFMAYRAVDSQLSDHRPVLADLGHAESRK